MRRYKKFANFSSTDQVLPLNLNISLALVILLINQVASQVESFATFPKCEGSVLQDQVEIPTSLISTHELKSGNTPDKTTPVR